jgi:hypothetical protein
MPQSQFDPDLGVLLNGEFRSVTVLDPALPGHVPNLVLDPTKDFQIEVTWRLNGTEVPPRLAVCDDNWVVTAYAESVGPGPEVILKEENEPKGNFTGGPGAGFAFDWSHTLNVPAGLLEEENPGPAGPSGTYRIIVTVFLNSSLPGAGYDIAGFNDGPMIKVENPQ